MLLLAVLADEPKHGYAVIAELHQRSGQVLDLPDGTVTERCIDCCAPGC